MTPPCTSWEKMLVLCAPPSVVRYSLRPKILSRKPLEPSEVSLGWCPAKPVILCPGSSSCSFSTTGFLKRYHFWLLRPACSLTPLFVLQRRRRVSPLGACCFPATELSTTKAGSQDDTPFVGDAGRLWAVGLLRTLHSRCAAPEDSLFSGLQLQRYEPGFHDASRTLGLQRQHAVPHSVRHAGPSEDAFHKRMVLAAIQKRGRWGSPKSVVRYEKVPSCFASSLSSLTDF